MANSTQLIEAVSRATQIASETLVVQMRNLRQAGLISIGGRGTSAAAMTAQDAARLLMAVAGTNFVKESVGAAVSFGSLVAYRRELILLGNSIFPITITPHWIDGPKHWSVNRHLNPDLAPETVMKRFGLPWLPIGASFEGALIGLIERNLSGELFPALKATDFVKPPARMPQYRKRLWISFYRPETYASVTYMAEGIVYEKVLFKKPERARAGVIKDAMAERSGRSAVLYRQSDINEETLEIVADALRTPTGHAPHKKKTKGVRALSI